MFIVIITLENNKGVRFWGQSANVKYFVIMSCLICYLLLWDLISGFLDALASQVVMIVTN